MTSSMNNVDQNPLNCQSSSRISPSRSTSSIDQFSHHHGKGDSAYSSFSGGSNAPDYSSPCLPEETHSHSLQYVDHKYVRAVFNPNVLNPDPKGMDHLYKSMETLNMQCHQDFNTQSATNQGYKEPPQPPARIDSFITIRNLENTKLCQSPEGQLQQRTRTVSSPDIVYCKPDSGSARRVSQANQNLPVKDYVPWEGADQDSSQKLEMKKFTNILSRSPPSFSLQECLRNYTGSVASGSEKQQRSPLYAQTFEQTGSQSRNSTQATQNMVNGNIQHKGQYYFVTGMCKPSEPSLNDSLSAVNARESKGRSKEDHGHMKHKEVSFHFRNDLPSQSRHKRQSSYEIPGVHGLKVYNESQCMQAWNRDQGCRNECAHSSSQMSPPKISKVPRSHSSEVPEPNPKAQSREIGYGFCRHHSSSHHIFYCRPEEGDQSSELPRQKEPVTSKNGSSVRCVGLISNKGDRGKRQPLCDVANDKINKETTPMLYHLTGESGGTFTYKTRNENEPGNWKSAMRSSGPFSKHKEASVFKPPHPISRSFHLSEGAEDENQDQGDTLCSSGSSVDDSYNKYYKEKIKNAQTKVLRETSFKRKDLQLSWPHRIKQKPSVRPSVIHSRASSVSSASDVGNNNPMHAGPEAKDKKETKKSQDSQPQPARIGARKRLKPEQKKLCYSEPERLNQLQDLLGQSEHIPAGNEEESSQEDFNEQGTFASRKKVFEERGRTLSVSSISKNELKQIQHNALVEYMERKSGQKPAGLQQVPSQNPQRLSTPERLADLGVTSSIGSGTQKQKRPRPLSAGRVLDSSLSSIRYAHSQGFQSIEFHKQPNRRQSATQAPGKSASMESLLDQLKRIRWTARSKSSSSPVQIDKNTPDTSPLPNSTSYNHQHKNGGDIVKKPVGTSHEEVRTVRERRGKSMEELGISATSGPAVLSKSSEQLDQIWSGEMPRQPPKSRGWEQNNQSSRVKVPETTRKSESEVPRFKKDLIEPRSEEEPGLVKASSAFEIHPNALKTLSFQGVPCKTPSPPQGRSPLGPPVSGSPISGPSCKAPMEDSVFFNDHLSPQSLDCMGLPEIEPGLENTGPSLTELLHTRSEKGPDENEPRGRLKTAQPVQCLESGSVGDHHQGSLHWDSTQASTPASGSGVRTESSTSSPAQHAESRGPETCSKGAKPPLDSSTNAKDSATQLPVPPTGEMPSVVPTTAPAGEPVQDNSITNKAKPENEMEDQTGSLNPSSTKPPSKSTVEQRWEEMATAIVAKDLSLADVLVPESNRKTTLKLMEQLLSDDTLLMEEYYKRKEARRHSKESDENPEKCDSIPLDTPGIELLANTSTEQKTTKDTQGDPSDVIEKKVLIENIKWKLQGLEEQKEELEADLRRNSVLGVSVETAVRSSCKPNEYERYTLFIGDLEKVVNLLLCLSSRLARVENALSKVNQATDPDDKQSLIERHRLLCKQHEDAKDLKENLLRRERVVSEILLKYLNQQQLQDYKHFVKVKASLLIEQRDLDERVRVREEQLESLQNSIPPE
ncbi:protein Shroom1-like isoform X2 [Polyodon spathula]|uniref:protein Shroom1-like isoform X2 n=1 Tax=Polyodon spathula TaxID=7913 RepID=UPI001B7DCD42|nr:protein Shroom1-like isoform X2 [Polyodon spathula]